MIDRAGIIAAGKGERFTKQGIKTPKPLIPVGNVPLIERTVRSLQAAGAKEIVVILNTASSDVRRYLLSRFPPDTFLFIQKDTASSYESFLEVARTMNGSHFFISTVDSIYDPKALRDFLGSANADPNRDLTLSLTDVIDDEKPLWAKMAENGKISALGPSAAGSGTGFGWVTSGIYYGKQDILHSRGPADFSSLRTFLERTVTSGLNVFGYPMPPTIDVDTPHDLKKAEQLIKELS